MKEIWKDIEGYEGKYQVSNFGNIKSLNYKLSGKEKIMKLGKEHGYPVIQLFKNSNCKQFKVHRLVAQAFIPNPDNLPVVNHKDESRNNNRVDNLEWCTYKYNLNYGTARERNSDSNRNNPKKSKRLVCLETGIIYPSTMEVKRQLGYDPARLSLCCRGLIDKVHGLHWKYIDEQI